MYLDEKKEGESQAIARNREMAEILRTTTLRQVHGLAYNQSNGWVCAGGALAAHGIQLSPQELSTVIWMNDHLRLTFMQIADHIEAGVLQQDMLVRRVRKTCHSKSQLVS